MIATTAQRRPQQKDDAEQRQPDEHQPPAPVDAGGEVSDWLQHRTQNASRTNVQIPVAIPWPVVNIATDHDGADGAGADAAGADAAGADAAGADARVSTAAATGAPLAATVGLAATASRWYGEHARDLPWRQPGTSAWAVLVSEVMLQQTPVGRVIPAWSAWLERWPGPRELAAASPGDVVRMWGKLGYPRRALRLRECAVALARDHNGDVPADVAALLALPGIGVYTARAVATFAFGQRHPVVDINVRRVIARVVHGRAEPGPPSTRRDLADVEALLPEPPALAARASIALMELGAVICTAARPRCAHCPVAVSCRWRRAGYPAYDGPRARPQRFTGTDRQVRGRLLDVLRADPDPVPRSRLDVAWTEPVQRERALASLLQDGLVVTLDDGRYALPGH